MGGKGQMLDFGDTVEDEEERVSALRNSGKIDLSSW